jgi:hypothetical protein
MTSHMIHKCSKRDSYAFNPTFKLTMELDALTVKPHTFISLRIIVLVPHSKAIARVLHKPNILVDLQRSYLINYVNILGEVGAVLKSLHFRPTYLRVTFKCRQSSYEILQTSIMKFCCRSTISPNHLLIRLLLMTKCFETLER